MSGCHGISPIYFTSYNTVSYSTLSNTNLTFWWIRQEICLINIPFKVGFDAIWYPTLKLSLAEKSRVLQFSGVSGEMTRLLKKGLWGLLALMTHAAFAQNETTSMERESFMKIRLVMENAVVEAILDDNAASRDFAAMLPLDVTLSDYHQTEKIADLPSTLSTDGAPDGIDPAIGDITYYAPGAI